MPDPEMVSRAHRAAATLEQAWERWRVRHGLVAHPMPPVSSYVGYSIEEPWGRPRVVFGVDAHEAEVLAALLDSHEYATARTSMDQAAIDGRDMPNDQEVAAGQPAWAGEGDPRDAECAPGEVRRRIPAQVQSPESVTGRGLPGGGERGATFAPAPARGAGARQPAAVDDRIVADRIVVNRGVMDDGAGAAASVPEGETCQVGSGARVDAAVAAGTSVATETGAAAGGGAGLGGGTPGTEAEAGPRAEVGRTYGADEHEPPGHVAPPRDAGDGIAAELAGWAAGELPGQASARLAAWAAVGGVPTAGYRQPGTASAGTLAETAG